MLPMSDAPSRHIRHLFDAELRYQEGMTPVFEGDDRGHHAAMKPLRSSIFAVKTARNRPRRQHWRGF